jgi:hypothetical protein
MPMNNKQKLTTMVTSEQLEMVRNISRVTRISQAELFREAVEDLIRKYRGVVSEEFAGKVQVYMDKRSTLLEKLSK